MMQMLVLVLVYLSLSVHVGAEVITDKEFRTFCAKVSQKPKEFRNFRNHNIIQLTLERFNKKTGQECIDHIEAHCPKFLDLWEGIKANDQFGNPATEKYGKLGKCSPTTLRYAKIAADLQSFFNPLDQLKVVEIGGGYGGLCRILTQVFGVTDYTIIDCPESLQLTKKYLDQFNITTVQFLTYDYLIKEIKADLVISTETFSACNKEQQELFLKRIIKHSPRGYLLCNYNAKKEIVSFKPKELSILLRQLHSGLQSLPENPKTYPCCWLNIWNDL